MRRFLLLLAACDPAPAPVAPPVGPPGLRPDILLITIDTLRADRVGAYGDPLARTPVLDGLAAQGALFAEAHAVTPLTLPSHASLLTGLYPVNHGLRDNGGFRLAEGVPTLAEALAAGGYATGAFVSAYVLDGAWGLDRGFQEYRDPFHPQDVATAAVFGEVSLPGAEVVNAALAWWKAPAQADRPRFAWVHLYEPHTPWQEHPGWTGDPYRGEVAYADSLLQRLVDATDDGDLVVVTSDHGESLWDHGEREHGVLLGRSVTRVPWILRPPAGLPLHGAGDLTPRPAGASAARRPAGVDEGLVLEPVPDAPQARAVIRQPVSGVDLAPTLADYAGVALLRPPDGRSLRPLIEGQAMEPVPVYAETWFPFFHHGWAALQMAQDARLRLEQGAYLTESAWTEDPAGLAAVRVQAATVPALAAQLARWRGDEDPRPGPLSGQQAAALEALGYLSVVVAAGPEAPDPRDQVGLLAELHVAEALPAAQAVPALEAMVGANPKMADARISLALKRAELGDLAGALADNLALLEQQPEHSTALANAATLARGLQQPDLTLKLAARLRGINPQDPRGYRLQAAVYVDQDDAAQVLEVTRAGVAVAPDDPNLLYLLGLAEIQNGDPLAGVQRMQEARKAGTQANDVDLWIGAGHQRGGQIDEARKAYDAAIRSMPGDPRPWAMAGWMLYKADRCADARPYLINVAKRGARADPKVQEALQACGAR